MSAVEDRDLRGSDLDAPPLHARLTHTRRSSPGIYGWLARSSDVPQHPSLTLLSRPKMMRDLPPELRHVVESMEATKVGLLPKTYSKLKVNEELRRLLGIAATASDAVGGVYDRMTDAELVESLTKQANDLGIKINFSYELPEESE